MQKQICFSVYSGCRKRLYLSQVFSYFDDPAWRIVLEDIQLMYQAMKYKQRLGGPRAEAIRNKTRSEIQHELLLKLGVRPKEEPRNKPGFLLADSVSDEELHAIIGTRELFLTFEEFSEIKFENGVPDLLFFLIHVVCGEDLADYYAEITKMNGFRYPRMERTREFLVERQRTNAPENAVRRQDKELTKKLLRRKPNADTVIVQATVRIFQTMRAESKSLCVGAGGIQKEQFVGNSVSLWR